MSAPVIWRALCPCHAGGAYREAGEVFLAPDGEYDPAVREKIEAGVAEEGASGVMPGKVKGKPKPAPGVMPGDLSPVENQ